MEDRERPTKLQIWGREYETRFTRKFERRRKWVERDPKKVVCVIPGIILRVFVQPSRRVVRGEPLCILEAMKMENSIASPMDGRVKSVNVKAGQMVVKGELLFEME